MKYSIFFAVLAGNWIPGSQIVVDSKYPTLLTSLSAIG